MSDPYVAWCMDEAVWTWAMFVESKVHEYAADIPDPEQARQVGKQVRMALHGDDAVVTADPSSPPSDEVINAQARGEVDAPHAHRKFKDPAVVQ